MRLGRVVREGLTIHVGGTPPRVDSSVGALVIVESHIVGFGLPNHTQRSTQRHSGKTER